jgi:cell wall-associated NlpC family hydrolase
VTPEQRQAVVAEALSWERTPYEHQQALKGVGVDCAMFPLAVYQNAGLIPRAVPLIEYAGQWHLNQETELYMQWVVKLGGVETTELAPGNLVLYRLGRTFCHGALILDWPSVIHSELRRGVVKADGEKEGDLFRKERKVFTI